MNTKKEFRRRKTRNTSTYGLQYDNWKKNVTSQIDFKLNDAYIERDPGKKRGICEDFNAYADEKKQEFMDEKCKSLNVERDSKHKCSDEWSKIEAYIIDKIKENPEHSCNRTSSNDTKKKEKNGKKSKSGEYLSHNQSSISNNSEKTEAFSISNNLNTTTLKSIISATTSIDTKNPKPLPLSASKPTLSSSLDISPISTNVIQQKAVSSPPNVSISTSAPVNVSMSTLAPAYAPTTIIPTSNVSILSNHNNSSNITVGYTNNNTLNNTNVISSTMSLPVENIDHKHISPTNSVTIKPTKITPTIITTDNNIPLLIGFGSFLGILIFLIFLYKCTPIGSWFGNRRSKKKKKHKKRKNAQIYRASRSLGFPYKKLESNMKNFGTCNKTNNFICEITLEKETNVNERYIQKEPKENEHKEKIENVKQSERYDQKELKENEHKGKVENIEQKEVYERGKSKEIEHKEKIEKIVQNEIFGKEESRENEHKGKIENVEQNERYGEEKSKKNEHKEKIERKENIEEQNEIYNKREQKKSEHKGKSEKKEVGQNERYDQKELKENEHKGKVENIEQKEVYGRGESKKIEHKEKIEKIEKIVQNEIFGKEESRENEHKEKIENVEQNERYGEEKSKKNEHKEKIERKENIEEQNEIYDQEESRENEHKGKIENVEQNEIYGQEESKKKEHKEKIKRKEKVEEQNKIYDKREQKKSEHKGKSEKKEVEQNEIYDQEESKKIGHERKSEKKVEQNERYDKGESQKIGHKEEIEKIVQNEIFEKEEPKENEHKGKIENVEQNERYRKKESKKIEHKEKIKRKEKVEQNKIYYKEDSSENENKKKSEKIEQNEINIEAKSNIVGTRKLWKWKTIIEIHMIILEECQKEDWELNRREFLKICLEEFKEGIYLNTINSDVIVETDQEEITSIFLEEKPLWKIWTEHNDKLIEKWKKEPWFKNLKKEWKKEINKSVELIEKEEMIESTKNGTINPMLERQKIIWKRWIQKQNKLHTFDYEELLKQLLVEYEKEKEMKKNMETINREKIRMDIEKKDTESKGSNRNKLISRLRIEIHMIVLDECKKEEWILNKKEFLKTCIEELKLQDNSNEKELLEMEKEIMKNITLKKKKEELEKFKKEKCFIELKQEWMNNEKKYMEEVNKENLLGVNEEIIENPMLQKQRIIWKKHWEEMRKKLKNENKNKSFIMFMDEYNKGAIRKETDEINVVEKNIKENEIEKGREQIKYLQEEKKEELNRKDEKERKKKEKKIKHMQEQIENVKRNNNCMTLRKKLKWKTMIEIHMLLIEDCKQEVWGLYRGEFLEICLNEWLKNERPIEDVIDKEIIMEGEEESSNVALEKQKILSEKWIKRQKIILEEWKKEEEICIRTINKVEVMDKADEIEREKELWKQWIEKQREIFMRYDKEIWFNKLLEECGKEENQSAIKENKENIEEKKKNSKKKREVIIKEEENKKTKNKSLISHVCIEIRMEVLDQCKKEELKSMKHNFLRSYIEQDKENERLYEQEMGNKELDEIEKDRQMNFIIEKKIKQCECWKKEDWYQELKLDWKEEMKHMTKTTNKIKEEITSPILKTQMVQKKCQEKQKNILKKWSIQNKLEMPMKKDKNEEEIEMKMIKMI
ncbi:surface-associated interspersed protein (SURFIN) [Plasmodium relictum]|uniref:Surface-associated interspersed protein (SURFIN) n=1 Tax=Plasmodium relictum TaxID=85471 RepID=A0A1J1GKC1_PLARL|nr:surface-associated interspersed protein (SURFIN) [Plasmodium relictum]CRG85027.1 surface-associated interspersed protein (SURFIN) [Plasmodium relictum]